MAIGTVAILVPAGGMPRWIREVVDAAAGAVGSVTLVTVSDAGRKPAAVVRAYLALDRRIFARGDEPLAPVSAGSLTGTAEVLLRLAPGPTRWSGQLGELSLVVGGAPVGCEGAAVLAHLGRGSDTIETQVCWHAPGEPVRAVSFARVGVAAPSVHRTREAALAPAAGLVRRALGIVASETMEASSQSPAAATKSRSIALAAVLAGVRGGARIVAGRARERALRPCWRIAWRRAGRDLAAGDGDGFRVLPAPSGEHRADPFLLAHGGRHHLFFEQVRAGESKGVIAHAELRPDGTTTTATVVLEHETHLSYPFVFRRDGSVYMIPETSARGRIELYRAVRVPDRWELERVLLDGVRAVDATLVEDQERLWLFAAVAERRESISSQLSIFTAEALDGEWRPHPGNPVIRDVTRARPAGRIVRRGGLLLRPGQDCSGRYGAAIALNRIDMLTPEHYAETTIHRLRPRRHVAGHTWDADDAFEVVDVVVAGR